MAKPLITEIDTTQTFQNWLNKTNEMVGLFKDNALTASPTGDTTIGDATLTGDFTATNITADTLLSADAIASATPSGTIEFQSQADFVGTSATTAIFTYGASGGQVRFTDGSFSWDVGIEDTQDGANFIIDTGVDPVKFKLTPAGTLTVPNLNVIGSITANNFSGGSSDFEDTDGLPEGSNNLYFTTGRAQAAFSAGSNIDINSGAISVEDDLDVDQLRLNGASDNAYIDGTVDVGQPKGRLNVTFGGSSYSVANWDPSGLNVTGGLTTTGTSEFGGNIEVTGNIQATGNLITAYSASDRALKENLDVISNPLDKVASVNGYTFNYIGNTERVSGVIAQEIESVLPEVVYDHQTRGSMYKAVRYDGIIPLLIEAIKELKERVEELEGGIDDPA